MEGLLNIFKSQFGILLLMFGSFGIVSLIAGTVCKVVAEANTDKPWSEKVARAGRGFLLHALRDGILCGIMILVMLVSAYYTPIEPSFLKFIAIFILSHIIYTQIKKPFLKAKDGKEDADKA